MSSLKQWEAFQSGDEAPDVSATVLTSWRRSRWSGVHADRVTIPVHDASSTHTRLVAVAEPVMLKMADALADSRTSLALADRCGRVIWRWASDDQLAHALDSVDMVPGAVFDEALVGTNGIGTALETAQPTVVIGPDHYVESFHRWACAAAPVRKPYTNSIIGAVNVTCRAEDANQFFRLAAHTLAESVTAALREDAGDREALLHKRYLDTRHRTRAPLLALNRHTLIGDDASANLTIPHQVLWKATRGVSSGTRLEIIPHLEAVVEQVNEDDLEAGVIITLTDNISAADEEPGPAPLPLDVAGASSDALRRHLSPLERAECAVIARTLNACGGNKAATAEQLEITRGTLYHKLAKYRLN